MSDAVFYRKGIGDDDKAIEDTKYFIKTFGTKKPAEAANAAFSLTSIYEKQGDNDAVDQAPRASTSATYGSKGGADKLVIAHAKIGQILWRAELPGEAGRRLVREDHPRARGRDQEGQEEEGQGGLRRADAVRPRVEDQADRRQARRPQGPRGDAASSTRPPRRSRRSAARPAATRPARATTTRIGKIAEADDEFEKYLDLKFPHGPQLR